ncbi:MAG: glycosyltransferase family 4 protein [Lentimicrobiaceae bacterium]|nr:glycosyltransferase family 4 protein [Lentimicrobiaceae bacterium]
MKILQLTGYFIPEKAASIYLTENILESFANANIDVVIYASRPTRGLDDKEYDKYKYVKTETMFDKVTIHRFAMFREGKNPIIRALRYVLCWVKQFYYGCMIKGVDVIFLASTPPIQGILGGLLKKIKRVPFIYNLQDIFPDSLVGTGLAKKDGLLWKIGRVIENFTYCNADKIIVISQDFKRNIMAKGVPEDKIEVIYNWVDEQAVIPIPREENQIFDELNLDRTKFYIIYAGNLGNAQNVEIIIDTANQIKDNTDINFIIFGTGGLEQEYKDKVNSLKLNNVSFFPLQPYEKVSQVYGIGDACIVSCKKGLGGSAMPSKTWSIMSAGRAVIANFDEGELKTIIEKNNCGIFTKAGDKEAFKNAILELYNDKEKAVQLGKNGRKFIMENLTREIGTSKYVKVVKEVIEKNQSHCQ